MNENRVVIYSNGIADFQRHYEVGADTPLRVSIPVRQDHLADVLASFNVYGNVRLESPPSFRPSNELEGNISIDPQNVLECLATSLSGAKVRVEQAGEAIEGTLVGLHQEDEATAGEPIHPKSVIVLAERGLRRCVIREIDNFEFLDADVQKEIDKALQRNYQRIKPNSTFVELVLSTSAKSAEAVLQYTLPAAAWKISYRLRVAENHAAELQGFAIVDNNTDEDWTDFRVCVVTGEPITFSTDLAESKTPNRKHVNIVRETALGAVEVAASMQIMEAGADPKMAFLARNESRCRLEEPVAQLGYALDSAETAAAEIQEVGDFSIFESESSVTIPAKRSTVIPVFDVEVADAKTVLYYKHENHAVRPYRSIDFTNSVGFNLARGVCTVFEEGAYAGSCIVPALKPDETRLLPHTLDTGVSVQLDRKRQRDKVVALHLAEGFCYTSTRQRRETDYHVRNSHDRQVEIALDHPYVLSEPDIEARVLHDGKEEQQSVASKQADGVRYSVSVAPKSELTLTVVEQRIDQAKMDLVTTGTAAEDWKIKWIEQHLVQTNGPLALDDGIRECLGLHHDLQSKSREISDAVNETERLAARQERLRKNLKTGGQGELTNRWRTELDEAEQSIRRIEEEQIPALRDEETALESRLKNGLKSLSAEWTDEAGG